MAAAARFGSKAKASAADPTLVPAGIDASTYFSPQIPDEVRRVVPMLHATAPEVIQGAVKMLMKYFDAEIGDEEFIKFQGALKQQGEDFGILFTGLFVIIRIAVATKTSPATISAHLKSINVPTQVADLISRVINQSRVQIEERALVQRAGFTQLHKLRWRIDVTISSGAVVSAGCVHR